MTITKIWFEDSALFLEELPANEAYKTSIYENDVIKYLPFI